MILHNLADLMPRRIAYLARADARFQVVQSDVHVILDAAGPHHGDDTFSALAFSRDLRTQSILSPDYMQGLVASMSSCHLIWLSGEVCRGDDHGLVWLYAHERHHVHQHATWPQLRSLNAYIQAKSVHIGQRLAEHELPCELDAEYAAERMLLAEFGEKARGSFVTAFTTLYPWTSQRFDLMNARRQTWSGDVLHETRVLLNKSGGTIKRRLSMSHANNSNMNVQCDWLYT